jgi:hypothetical protein
MTLFRKMSKQMNKDSLDVIVDFIGQKEEKNTKSKKKKDMFQDLVDNEGGSEDVEMDS